MNDITGWLDYNHIFLIAAITESRYFVPRRPFASSSVHRQCMWVIHVTGPDYRVLFDSRLDMSVELSTIPYTRLMSDSLPLLVILKQIFFRFINKTVNHSSPM